MPAFILQHLRLMWGGRVPANYQQIMVEILCLYRPIQEFMCSACFGSSVWHNTTPGTKFAFMWEKCGTRGLKNIRNMWRMASWTLLYFAFDIYCQKSFPGTDFLLTPLCQGCSCSWRPTHIHTLHLLTLEYITFFYIWHWAVSLRRRGDSVPCSRALGFV